MEGIKKTAAGRIVETDDDLHGIKLHYDNLWHTCRRKAPCHLEGNEGCSNVSGLTRLHRTVIASELASQGIVACRRLKARRERLNTTICLPRTDVQLMFN